MYRYLFLAILTLITGLTAEVRAEVDAEEAFKAHRQLMSKGVWVSKDESGKALVIRHVPSKSKKFVQIRSLVGDETVAAIYGIDPNTSKLTLWSFRQDGSVGVWICTAYGKDRWTWEGKTVGPEGVVAGTAQVVAENADEVKFMMEGEESYEQLWKRQ